MLRQVHIFDIKAANPIFQQAYLANALVNSKNKPQSFYKIDLLLEHQNKEFKQFCADRGLSLQENDKMFRLHALLVDALKKVRSFINCIIVGKEKNRYNFTKNVSFDILSFANKLHKLKSTYLERLECSKIYFSENQVSDLVKLGLEYLP